MSGGCLLRIPRYISGKRKSDGVHGGFTVVTQRNWPCLGVVNSVENDSRTLWLVRHGESTWNELGLIQGHAEGPVLTEKGQSQSLDVAHRLQGTGVQAIYASDLARAQQTAALIGAALELPVQTDPALRERCFGVLEGRPFAELDSLHSGIRDERVIDASARPVGGESLDDLHARVGTFMTWLEDEPLGGGDVVVVTHGGTIRALRAYCAGVAMRDSQWDQVPNGSVWGVRQPAVVHTTKC
jgi:2,3-bisphosphoglycerate-dependent phosphoglycerate mutase